MVSMRRAAIVFAILVSTAPATLLAQDVDAPELYNRYCATCHDAGVNRAPTPEAFRSMPADRVLAAMETGAMITMANNRTAPERRAIAAFLTGKSLSTPFNSAPAAAAMCRSAAPPFDAATGSRWIAWGHDVSNTRFQDSAAAGLTAADVPRLKLKWAFAFPGDLQSYSQATLAGGRLFVGSWGGKVYSLDAATGCVHWFFEAQRGVRAAIAMGRIQTAAGPREAAFIGDTGANVYAVEASTGEMLWQAKIDDFPVARINGSPTLN